MRPSVAQPGVQKDVSNRGSLLNILFNFLFSLSCGKKAQGTKLRGPSTRRMRTVLCWLTLQERYKTAVASYMCALCGLYADICIFVWRIVMYRDPITIYLWLVTLLEMEHLKHACFSTFHAYSCMEATFLHVICMKHYCHAWIMTREIKQV